MMAGLRGPSVPDRRRVLWAEDNREDQILIRAALADMPHAPRVEFANDGAELLEMLEAAGADLVVLDLKMPRIGGLEALRLMRASPKARGLPVAVFSAGDQQAETAACMALGAKLVLQKPVDFRLFTAAVHRLVSTGADGPG
jgi:two-component system, response regulator